MTRRKVLQGGAILGGMAAAGVAGPIVSKVFGPEQEKQSNKGMRELTNFRLQVRDRVYKIGQEQNGVRRETVIDNLFKKTKGDERKLTDQMIVDEFKIVDKE